MNTSHPSIRYHIECINDGQLEVMREIMAPEFVNLATGFDPMHGVDAMIAAVKSILEGFPGATAKSRPRLMKATALRCSGASRASMMVCFRGSLRRGSMSISAAST